MSSYTWPTLGGGGVTVYTNLAAFPASSFLGDLGVAADTGFVYEWRGAAWIAVAGPGVVTTVGNLTDVGTDGIVITGGTGAVVGSGTSIAQHVADSTHNGYLSSADWSTFNAKQAALTIGNLTDVGTDGIVITGGTGAVIGSGASIAQQVSDSTHNGYLSSTDWSTFNGKQGAGNYITALTGDGTASGPGSVAFTLATVNSNVGSFGSASSAVALTVNAKGLVTAASATAIQIAESQVTNLVSDLAGKQPIGNYITALTGDATAAGPGSVALTLATVNSNVGSFGSSTSIPSFTVNAKGLITAASGNVVIAPAGTLTGTTLASNVVTSSLTAVGTIISGTWTGTTIALANGGTGQTTKAAAFDALSPMTTGGDLIYGGASGTGTRLANGTSGQFLKSNGTTTAPSWDNPSISLTRPKVTTYTSGSGTHTLTGSPLYVRVRLVGGGGGGGAATTNDGTAGTASTLSTLSAGGGAGGQNSGAGGAGGAGGTSSIGAGWAGTQMTGTDGGGGNSAVTAGILSGEGGGSYFGGRGPSGTGSGAAGATNSGSGGSGGQSTVNTGAGGGSGGYVEAITTGTPVNYSYSVGAGGTRGAAGGAQGGNGAAGYIEVTEYYQ